MMPGQIMRVCRECPENNLPECGKGKCDRRDEAIAADRARRDALRRDKAARAIGYAVTVGKCRKGGQL